MAEVIFHIGVHEAMAAALQRQLHAARHSMRRVGLRYPSLGRYYAHHWMAGAWVYLPRGLERRDPEGTLRRLLRHVPEGHSVLLSSQEFWRAAPNPVGFAALAGMIPKHMARRVVVVLRDQASLLPALWYAMGRGRDPGLWHDRMAELLETGHLDGLDLDYHALWERLRAGFAADEIVFIEHDRLAADARGPAAAMLEALNLPQAAAMAPSFHEPERPIAPVLHFARHVAQMVAAPMPSGPALVRACRRIAEHHHPGQRLEILTAKEHQAVLDRFGPCNDRLRAVADAPDLNRQMQREGAVFRDQLGPDFWIDLCMRIHAEAQRKE